jgi:hypothetical protein
MPLNTLTTLLVSLSSLTKRLSSSSECRGSPTTPGELLYCKSRTASLYNRLSSQCHSNMSHIQAPRVAMGDNRMSVIHCDQDVDAFLTHDIKFSNHSINGAILHPIDHCINPISTPNWALLDEKRQWHYVLYHILCTFSHDAQVIV